MFSWKSLWSLVLTLTFLPDFFSYAEKAAAYAFLGTGSEALDPTVTSFLFPPGPSPQADSRAGSVSAPAPRAAPRKRFRRDIR